jgi:hypothetical protein
MAWTYSDPNADPKDAVRFLVGDTDDTDPLVSDEEIQYALAQWSNPYRAGAYVCESLAAKFAREVSHSGDGLSFSGSDLHKHYLALADRLLVMAKRAGRKGAKPYAGGLSWAERQHDDADEDLIKTAFRSHMHDNPRKGRASNDELRPSQ